MGVYCLEPRTYYRHLFTIIYPVIWCIWLVHQSEVLQEARVSEAAAIVMLVYSSTVSAVSC